MESAGRPRKHLVRKTITVPANLQTYCDEFNAGLFFESHEHLEEVWQQERGPVRDFYKGLIQLAAAYVHLGRGNLKGGERLCRTGLQYLKPYEAAGALGFDVRAVRAKATEAHEAVLRAMAAGNAGFDLTQRPVMRFDRSALPAEALRWSAWGFDGAGSALPMEVVVAE